MEPYTIPPKPHQEPPVKRSGYVCRNQIPVEEPHYKLGRQEKSRAFNGFWTSTTEKKELVKDVGIAPAFLYCVYLDLVNEDAPYDRFKDESIAQVLNITVSAVKKQRLTLTNKGWFLHKKNTGKGRVDHHYFFGKSYVASLKFGDSV